MLINSFCSDIYIECQWHHQKLKFIFNFLQQLMMSWGHHCKYKIRFRLKENICEEKIISSLTWEKKNIFSDTWTSVTWTHNLHFLQDWSSLGYIPPYFSPSLWLWSWVKTTYLWRTAASQCCVNCKWNICQHVLLLSSSSHHDSASCKLFTWFYQRVSSVSSQ